MLSRIEYIHSKHYIHRDIKPENFLMGIGKKTHQLYIIDYGLAKQYYDPIKKCHIPYKEGRNLTGTVRYISINTHLGIEQSRRDDIQSIAYILIYLLKGKLPWQGIKVKNEKEKYSKIKEMKIQTTIEELCMECPNEIQLFLKYSQEMKFDEKPDYVYLRQLLKTICENHNFYYNFLDYDWNRTSNFVNNSNKNNKTEKEDEEELKKKIFAFLQINVNEPPKNNHLNYNKIKSNEKNK